MIDYDSSGGNSGSFTVNDGSTDEYTLTDLQNGDTYTISIVAISDTAITSESVVPMDVGLGESSLTLTHSTEGYIVVGRVSVSV